MMTASSAPARKPKVAVVRAADEHAEVLADFYRAVWDPFATAEGVRSARAAAAERNPVTPGVEPPTFLFLSDGRVLGHITTIPVRFWNGHDEVAAYWFNGLMVLPEFRNGLVAHSLLKQAVQELPLTACVTVTTAAQRLFQALGFANHGAPDNYIAVLRPACVLRQLDIQALGIAGVPGWLSRAIRAAQRAGLATFGGFLASGALTAWRAFGAPRQLKCVVRTGTGVTAAELDDLWTRVRPTLAAAPVRDGKYLTWRYDSDAAYERLAVYDARRIVAAAVVRRPRDAGDSRLRGIKVATLSDLVFPADRPDAGLAALAGAEALARRLGAHALLCTASHPAVTGLLPRRAYVRLPGNVHFMLRDPKGRHRMPASLDAWWLTRGDAEADQVF
jgi:GNAT superfamily N-acetyltransferase